MTRVVARDKPADYRGVDSPAPAPSFAPLVAPPVAGGRLLPPPVARQLPGARTFPAAEALGGVLRAWQGPTAHTSFRAGRMPVAGVVRGVARVLGSARTDGPVHSSPSFSPDGRFVAVGSTDGHLRTYEVSAAGALTEVGKAR